MNWLDLLLKEAGITPAELSRRSFLDEGLISRIRKGKIRATTDTLKAIAKGLDLPVDKVYRVAGELPSIAEPDAKKQELDYLLSRVSESVLDDVLEFTRFITKRRNNNEQKGKG